MTTNKVIANHSGAEYNDCNESSSNEQSSLDSGGDTEAEGDIDRTDNKHWCDNCTSLLTNKEYLCCKEQTHCQNNKMGKRCVKHDHFDPVATNRYVQPRPRLDI